MSRAQAPTKRPIGRLLPGTDALAMRADQLLVARGLAPSRTLAQRLISAGRVLAGGPPGVRVRKPAEALDEQIAIAVSPGEEDRYVSRGGLKLQAALARCEPDITGWLCLDVGQSTGGFTDCLLQAGAQRVVGLDVGHGQLHPSIRQDPRVMCLEGVNARTMSAASVASLRPAQGFDLIVIDVSFISLTLVMPALGALASESGRLLALVKPQFEVGRDHLDRRGLVRSPDRYPEVRADITASATHCGWRATDWFDSPITGGDGNREFFIYARWDASSIWSPSSDRTSP